jgi:membrane protein DedA with SNARE-associated domain
MRIPPEHRSHVRTAVIAVAAVAAYVAIGQALPEIDLEAALEDVSRSLGDWTYLLVGGLAFLETGAFVGLVVPGETFTILGGAVAGQGEVSLALLIAVVWFSAWAGDSVSFLIGRRTGRGFVLRHGHRVRITPERFKQVEDYFARRGGMTILIGRFIGLVRALAPFVAGSSGMRYRAFVPYSILGTGLWAATFTLIGYFASRSLNEAAKVAGRGTFLFGVVVALIVGIVLAARFLRMPENRARLVAVIERRRSLRPLLGLARRIQPQVRFVWERLTPGPLGLELTALIAALAVGLYVFLAYAVVLGGDPSPTPGDGTALDVARKLETGWLTDLNLAVTKLGSLTVSLAVAAAGGLFLAWRRSWLELAVLAVAALIAFNAVPILKEEIMRPRPADGIASAGSAAFPSGHATHSIVYAWLAVTIATRIRHGRVLRTAVLRTALVTVGIVIAASVGLSRVYLRVHYLSDVSGGWALGVSVFSACAIVALVIARLRQTAGDE